MVHNQTKPISLIICLMKQKHRMGVVFLSLIVLLIILISCSNNTTKSTSKNALNAILITDVGGLGDKGFNDAGWKGCQDAQKRLAERGVDVEIQFIESREQSDYIENLNMASERAEVVVALGFLIQDAVAEVSGYHPDKSYIFIDGEVEGDNVASFVFRSNEAAFLGGILSAYVTQTDKVGVLLGMDIPPVENYAAGYKAGVRTGAQLLEKEIGILSNTIGSFADPVKAKSMAQSLLDQNADILLQLAGLSGVGVIEAVKEYPGRAFAIGGDINQDDMAPGLVLTSILKRMDQVVADQIIAVHDGEFEGGVFNVGLEEGYVGVTDMQYTQDKIPAEALQRIDQAKRLIIDNTITVPDTDEKLEQYNPAVDAFSEL